MHFGQLFIHQRCPSPQYTVFGLNPHIFPCACYLNVPSAFFFPFVSCWFLVNYESKILPRYSSSPDNCMCVPWRKNTGLNSSNFFFQISASCVGCSTNILALIGLYDSDILYESFLEVYYKSRKLSSSKCC